jgi:4a-hydroxytetrahydrobiopterin dehydratase
MRISLTTHDAGGLTELDFKLASRIEEILRAKGL